MKQIKLIILLGILSLGSSLFAQQEPLNTMYMYNGIAVNPAYAGTRESLSITALHRRQWVSLAGAPVTSSLAMHMPIEFTNLSVGMSIVSDQIGPVNDFYGNLFCAYKLKINKNLNLSMGMSFGFYNYNASLSELNLGDNIADNSIGDYDKIVPNGGTGIYLYSDKFYVGLSAPKLFKSNLSGFRADATELARHYYFSAGYVFELSENYALKPSVLSKYVHGAPWTQDFNLQLFIQDKFSLGATYRINNAVAFMAGYHIANKWMLGYSYGLSTSDLSQYNNGSHEIILTFDLRMTKSIVRTPRYYF